ncbi:hypothetical protein SIAM614_06043 [Stappia aggregata IAM 12614]|uniref:Uncharacterized protein n=1 Tax=Roseibium aggregatum (strain ATCC 25650 / DSM 13394 / JCM 20685 / NBRC 16684 / NCIMB 2208 / IAM 12614 / B1) TaxID=384765 RepID=A0NV54_ROSAI|nr:hypothetical protein SIAM614_06043 [Stappia aggregata IAM 12614] [Roseibium aggregatum IAM 12614]
MEGDAKRKGNRPALKAAKAVA